jgi:hypothetical protein
MIVALLMPYVMAYLVYELEYGGALILADVGGLFIALLSIPFISIVVIVVAYLWYNNEYWFSDVAKTSQNALALLFIIGYPIAFSITANSSMGTYFVGAYLIVIFVASYLYKWQPRVPTETGYKMGLFWAGVVAVAVLLITSLDALNHGLSTWLSELMSLDWYKHVMLYSMTAWFIAKLGFVNSLQVIPIIGLMAFVVGFSEEGWARLSIPLVAKYLDDNVTLSVWWLGATWLSLHAVVIALEVGLSAVPINLLILSIISIFIFYVFAKTGDYVATAIAHGFYDLMVSLGLIGLILGIVFIVLFFRYHSVP